jgi:hypothetical protein
MKREYDAHRELLMAQRLATERRRNRKGGLRKRPQPKTDWTGVMAVTVIVVTALSCFALVLHNALDSLSGTW